MHNNLSESYALWFGNFSTSKRKSSQVFTFTYQYPFHPFVFVGETATNTLCILFPYLKTLVTKQFFSAILTICLEEKFSLNYCRFCWEETESCQYSAIDGNYGRICQASISPRLANTFPRWCFAKRRVKNISSNIFNEFSFQNLRFESFITLAENELKRGKNTEIPSRNQSAEEIANRECSTKDDLSNHSSWVWPFPRLNLFLWINISEWNLLRTFA